MYIERMFIMKKRMKKKIEKKLFYESCYKYTRKRAIDVICEAYKEDRTHVIKDLADKDVALTVDNICKSITSLILSTPQYKFLGYDYNDEWYSNSWYGYGPWLIPQRKKLEAFPKYRRRVKTFVYYWMSVNIIQRGLDCDIVGLSERWIHLDIRCESYNWSR